VDSARRQVEDWGGVVVAVVPGPAATRPTRLNLVPHEARLQSGLWRRWQLWAPVALVAVGAMAVLLVPLLQKREYAIALNKQMESAREQAEVADGLRALLERQQGDYNYVLAKKYAYPGAVQIIDDITRLLPDDTWVTQLEMRSAVRGKETARELTLRGESANAGALISTLEESKLVDQAALQSPTTKLQPGPGEVFVLGARLRNGTPPEPVPLAATTAPAAPPALPTPQAAATGPAAAASTTPIPESNAPAAAVLAGPPSSSAAGRPTTTTDASAIASPAAITPGVVHARGGAGPAPASVGGRS
jgi:Tfp pilus assembly protein PilN